MPTALFYNVPGHGHVNPSLPLVAELVQRGHHITYFITENYRTKVEAAGAVFQPYATVHDDYFDVRGLDGSRPMMAARAMLTTSEEILPELLETARRANPDYVMYDGMCPWGYWVARILGVPAVASLALLPIPPRALLNPTMLRVMVKTMVRESGPGMEANKRSQALGKRYNVPHIGPMSLMSAPADLSICYTSSTFQPFADTLPDSIKFVGRTIDDTPSNEPFSFERVQGRRLIYISLGTLINNDASFFRACIGAFAGSDAFAIITTGNRISPESFDTLPENIEVHSWVPQSEVLKRAALFITHAGLNSVHDGLYFGVPLLLVPQQDEQTWNARRVVQLRAGLMLKKGQVNVQNLRSHASRLITEAYFKAEATRIGETFRAAGGMTRAADDIEALLRTRAPKRKLIRQFSRLDSGCAAGELSLNVIMIH